MTYAYWPFGRSSSEGSRVPHYHTIAEDRTSRQIVQISMIAVPMAPIHPKNNVHKVDCCIRSVPFLSTEFRANGEPCSSRRIQLCLLSKSRTSERFHSFQSQRAARLPNCSKLPMLMDFDKSHPPPPNLEVYAAEFGAVDRTIEVRADWARPR